MKDIRPLLVTSAAVLVAVAASSSQTAAAANVVVDYTKLFDEFKRTYLKQNGDDSSSSSSSPSLYYPSREEESMRFQIFVENMKRAAIAQSQNPLATFGVGPFADRSPEEFQKTHRNAAPFFRRKKQNIEMMNSNNHMRRLSDNKNNNNKIQNNLHRHSAEDKKRAAGAKIDWRSKGAVTPVKNQGMCGGCWAFSATGNIEGQWFLAGNPLTSLSEEELIACDTVDAGCNGGLVDNAFNWLIQQQKGQVVTEASLPYASGSGVTPACPSPSVLDTLAVGAVISSYVDIEKNEDALASYCFDKGPVSVGVDSTSFHSYTSGIITNCISNEVDLAVLVVGFDDQNVPPYWIVKNSWGPQWGEHGYLRVAKGSNQCLIAAYPTSAVVGGSTTTATTGAPIASSTSAVPPPFSTTTPSTPPPTPAPGPGLLIQNNCDNSKCTLNCQNNTFPLEKCLALQSGGSVIVRCLDKESRSSNQRGINRRGGMGSAIAAGPPQSVQMTSYPYSVNCVGKSTTGTMSTRQCLENVEGGGYFENYCVDDDDASKYGKPGKFIVVDY